MKKVLLSLLIALQLFSCVSMALSAADNGVVITIDGVELYFSEQSGEPFIDENERTLVPVRAVMETYGCDVEWDDATKTVTIYKDGREVVVPIGAKHIYVDGVFKSMDTAAIIKDGRTYLPLRPILEAFDADVEWSENGEVTVRSPEYVVIDDVYINGDGELVFIFSDGSEKNVGRVVGEDGLDGNDGADGLNGANGMNGRDGMNGLNGKDGIDGINGKDGVSVHNVYIHDGHLMVQLSNGKTLDAGSVTGAEKASFADFEVGKRFDTTEPVAPFEVSYAYEGANYTVNVSSMWYELTNKYGESESWSNNNGTAEYSPYEVTVHIEGTTNVALAGKRMTLCVKSDVSSAKDNGIIEFPVVIGNDGSFTLTAAHREWFSPATICLQSITVEPTAYTPPPMVNDPALIALVKGEWARNGLNRLTVNNDGSILYNGNVYTAMYSGEQNLGGEYTKVQAFISGVEGTGEVAFTLSSELAEFTFYKSGFTYKYTYWKNHTELAAQFAAGEWKRPFGDTLVINADGTVEIDGNTYSPTYQRMLSTYNIVRLNLSDTEYIQFNYGLEEEPSECKYANVYINGVSGIYYNIYDSEISESINQIIGNWISLPSTYIISTNSTINHMGILGDVVSVDSEGVITYNETEYTPSYTMSTMSYSSGTVVAMIAATISDVGTMQFSIGNNTMSFYNTSSTNSGVVSTTVTYSKEEPELVEQIVGELTNVNGIDKLIVSEDGTLSYYGTDYTPRYIKRTTTTTVGYPNSVTTTTTNIYAYLADDMYVMFGDSNANVMKLYASNTLTTLATYCIPQNSLHQYVVGDWFSYVSSQYGSAPSIITVEDDGTIIYNEKTYVPTYTGTQQSINAYLNDKTYISFGLQTISGNSYYVAYIRSGNTSYGNSYLKLESVSEDELRTLIVGEWISGNKQFTISDDLKLNYLGESKELTYRGAKPNYLYNNTSNSYTTIYAEISDNEYVIFNLSNSGNSLYSSYTTATLAAGTPLETVSGFRRYTALTDSEVSTMLSGTWCYNTSRFTIADNGKLTYNGSEYTPTYRGTKNDSGDYDTVLATISATDYITFNMNQSETLATGTILMSTYTSYSKLHDEDDAELRELVVGEWSRAAGDNFIVNADGTVTYGESTYEPNYKATKSANGLDYTAVYAEMPTGEYFVFNLTTAGVNSASTVLGTPAVEKSGYNRFDPDAYRAMYSLVVGEWYYSDSMILVVKSDGTIELNGSIYTPTYTGYKNGSSYYSITANVSSNTYFTFLIDEAYANIRVDGYNYNKLNKLYTEIESEIHTNVVGEWVKYSDERFTVNADGTIDYDGTKYEPTYKGIKASGGSYGGYSVIFAVVDETQRFVFGANGVSSTIGEPTVTVSGYVKYDADAQEELYSQVVGDWAKYYDDRITVNDDGSIEYNSNTYEPIYSCNKYSGMITEVIARISETEYFIFNVQSSSASATIGNPAVTKKYYIKYDADAQEELYSQVVGDWMYSPSEWFTVNDDGTIVYKGTTYNPIYRLEGPYIYANISSTEYVGFYNVNISPNAYIKLGEMSSSLSNFYKTLHFDKEVEMFGDLVGEWSCTPFDKFTVRDDGDIHYNGKIYTTYYFVDDMDGNGNITSIGTELYYGNEIYLNGYNHPNFIISGESYYAEFCGQSYGSIYHYYKDRTWTEVKLTPDNFLDYFEIYEVFDMSVAPSGDFLSGTVTYNVRLKEEYKNVYKTSLNAKFSYDLYEYEYTVDTLAHTYTLGGDGELKEENKTNAYLSWNVTYGTICGINSYGVGATLTAESNKVTIPENFEVTEVTGSLYFLNP